MRENEGEGGRKLVRVSGLVWCTFDADPHLKDTRHSLAQRTQLEGNGPVIVRREEVVERPLRQFPALSKLLLTNVGHCRLLTHGGDASLRHRHAVLCVCGHILSFSEAGLHVRMLVLFDIFVSMCVCVCLLMKYFIKYYLK